MALTFRSSTPETFQIVGREPNGAQRVATATRVDGSGNRWNMQLQHPSGRSWKGDFHGQNVLDGLAELLNSKDVEYRQERSRGYRPEAPTRDNSVSVNIDGTSPPPIISNPNRR
jgi:hypothetical protein